MATSFYPKLSSLVSLNGLPEPLDVFEDILDSLTNKVYYKHLQFSKSVNGETAFYSLTLVFYGELGINFFNTGFSLLVNRGNAGETNLPVIFSYNLPILGVIKEFSADQFSFETSPRWRKCSACLQQAGKAVTCANKN